MFQEVQFDAIPTTTTPTTDAPVSFSRESLVVTETYLFQDWESKTDFFDFSVFSDGTVDAIMNAFADVLAEEAATEESSILCLRCGEEAQECAGCRGEEVEEKLCLHCAGSARRRGWRRVRRAMWRQTLMKVTRKSWRSMRWKVRRRRREWKSWLGRGR